MQRHRRNKEIHLQANVISRLRKKKSKIKLHCQFQNRNLGSKTQLHKNVKISIISEFWQKQKVKRTLPGLESNYMSYNCQSLYANILGLHKKYTFTFFFTAKQCTTAINHVKDNSRRKKMTLKFN